MMRERQFQRNELSLPSKQTQVLLARNSDSSSTKLINSPQSHNDNLSLLIRSNAKNTTRHTDLEYRKMILTWWNACSRFYPNNQAIIKKCVKRMKQTWVNKAREVRNNELKIQLLHRKLRMIFIWLFLVDLIITHENDIKILCLLQIQIFTGNFY